MEYLGKTVRLNPDFVAHKANPREDDHFKEGIVIDQVNLSDSRCLLIVDDPLFGTWKAVDRNVEEVLTSYSGLGDSTTH